jgi:hypothetical protein
MLKPGLTFETKCYENDWRLLLQKDYLRAMIEKCNYHFEEKILNINNVSDINEVKKAADRLISRDILTCYIVVEDHAGKVLDAFDLTRESFNRGYYYSIAELTAIFFCNTEFLLHFSGDSIIEKSDFNWIDRAISMIAESPGILVANPTWNNRYWEAKKESFGEDDDWYHGYGFSDQCYLVMTERLKGKVYNEFNEASARYPKHGGDSFEKRVDSYMRNKQLTRITSKHVSYTHKNFPKSRVGKKLLSFRDKRFKI